MRTGPSNSTASPPATLADREAPGLFRRDADGRREGGDGRCRNQADAGKRPRRPRPLRRAAAPSGASVVLQSAGDAGFGRGMLGGGQSAVSDASGRFRFDHLASGRYSLVASLRNRSSATQTVVLQDGPSRDDAVLRIAAV